MAFPPSKHLSGIVDALEMSREARHDTSGALSSSSTSSSTSSPSLERSSRTTRARPIPPITHDPLKSPLHELLSKLERNPGLVEKLLREVEKRETDGHSTTEVTGRGREVGVEGRARARQSSQRSIDEQMESRVSRTRVGSRDEGTVDYAYLPTRSTRHTREVGGDSSDVEAGRRARRDYEHSSSGAEEEGSDREESSLLRGRGIQEREAEGGGRRSRTKVNRGPVSTIRQMASNASSFLRGRSPGRRHPPSISSSVPASASRSPSQSSSSSESLPHNLCDDFDYINPYANPDPHLRPFHKPSIDVDFDFPSFDKTGFPLIQKNKFLPSRLHSHSHPTHLDARQREVREEGEHWRPRRNRSFGRGRAGDGEIDGGGPCFPCLLAMVLVVLPVALLALILGIVFRVARIDA